MHFQDLGRFGYAHLGISHGGPIDLHAHCWANFLLENDSNATSIEISIGNTSFLALEDSVIAITGAEMNARIDGLGIQNWSSHFIKKGRTIKLGFAAQGIHSYLAIKGGFMAQQRLGSSATVVRNHIGEYLTEGNELKAHHFGIDGSFTPRQTPSHYIPDYNTVEEIRMILPSKQDSAIANKLLDTSFAISPHSDRMGINLISETPLPSLPGIISEGIALGSIQLPPNGHPIVLLNDRQTQGGYAKIGNIARIDLPILAQAKPSTRIKFIPLSPQQATNEWAEFSRFFGL
jgi:allophanate hydrolase